MHGDRYLGFEGIRIGGINTIIGHHVEKCIVHVSTLASMITIGNCRGSKGVVVCVWCTCACVY